MGSYKVRLSLILLALSGCTEKEVDHEKLMHGNWHCESTSSSQGLIMFAAGNTTLDRTRSSFTTDTLISTDYENGGSIAQVKIISSGTYKADGPETTYTFVESKSKVLKGSIDPKVLEKMDQQKIDNPSTVVTTKITKEIWISHPKGSDEIIVTCKRNHVKN